APPPAAGAVSQLRAGVETSLDTAGTSACATPSLHVADSAVDEDDLHILVEVSLLLPQVGHPRRLSHASHHVRNALADLDGHWPGGAQVEMILSFIYWL